MTDLKFTITETIHCQRGQIIEITYDYDETKQEQVVENMQTKEEKRSRAYHAAFKRNEYDNIANKIRRQRNVLSFDIFVKILRPFMMGIYATQEIHEAFCLLDQNSSHTIDLDGLFAFLPVIHPNMTKETLLNCINKVSKTGNQEINFDQFKELILRGIGRDIVCGNV